jgi:preprotein translocase subunit SecE
VARDRQRAKQRKQRREPTPPRRHDDAPEREPGLEPEPQHLHRENAPAAFEHTGDIDEFEAAIVAGAEGQPEDDPDAVERASVGGDEPPPTASATDAAAPMGRAPGPGEAAHGRGGSRFINFLRACWAELQRVQWPDRRQVGQATMVVLGFVLIAGAFLGFADFVAEKIVDLIL